MARPHLVLSNYNEIIMELGNNWGKCSGHWRQTFSFTHTLSKKYDGPKIHHVLDCGMSAYWISSGEKKLSESVNLVLSDRDYVDWRDRTGFGAAYFIKGVVLDGQYGTTLVHPHRIANRIGRDELSNKECGPDQFIAESRPELRDFFVKHILFNLE
jgi:hypothetical protein